MHREIGEIRRYGGQIAMTSTAAPRASQPRHHPGRLVTAVLAASVLACGCDGELLAPGLPAAPAVQVDGLDPDAEAQLTAAQADFRAEPESALANARLARLLHAYAQPKLAATYYRRARSLDPDNSALAHLHGLALSKFGARDEAIEALRAANDLDRSYAPTLLKLADLLADAGDIEASRAYYEAVLQVEPDLPQALLGLGKLRAADNPRAALALMRRAATVGESYGAAHYAIAQVLRDSGDIDGARRELEAFERHRGQAPDLDDPVMGQVRRLNLSRDGHLGRALDAYRHGRLTVAAREFEKTLEKDPDNTTARQNLLVVYGQLGRYDEAEAQYRLALQSDPAAVKLHANYALLHLKQQNYSKAIEAYQTAIEIDPGYGKSYIGIGTVHRDQGDRNEAMKWYRAALENDPSNREARHHLAAALIERGRYKEAIEKLTPALEPDDVTTAISLRVLASAQVYAWRYDQAEKSLIRARELARRFKRFDIARAAQEDIENVRQARATMSELR